MCSYYPVSDETYSTHEEVNGVCVRRDKSERRKERLSTVDGQWTSGKSKTRRHIHESN